MSKFDKLDGDQVKAYIQQKGEESTEIFDTVMFAVGRLPNVHGLGLEEAGIKYDANLGILVDKNLRTSNELVYAVGDCIPGPKFTHNSDVQARTVVKNALFYGDIDKDTIPIPYCTFTDPEIAHVGLNERQLQ